MNLNIRQCNLPTKRGSLTDEPELHKYAFTETVKSAQKRYGTRRSSAGRETAGDRYRLTEREADFIQLRNSFYMATVGENGWPYVQLRGGPRGFVKVLDDTTLGYADFRGNG